MKKVIVIGAGIGGLTSAILLAHKGYRVDLFEKNSTPGGKMQERINGPYRFDTGPSLLTMPFMLVKIFRFCGENINDYLNIRSIEPLCRYFYSDGQVFDNYSDRDKSKHEIQKFAPEDVKAYDRFLNRSEKLYRRTSEAFLFNPLYHLKDFRKLNLLNFFRIDAFTTVSNRIDRTFKSEYLRIFFKRFTTYNGSSPYKAPATLNVIPHVELNQGSFYVDGGMYEIARALSELAIKQGVTFHYNSTVEKIEADLESEQVIGIILSNGLFHSADYIFANTDATDTIMNLLPQDAIPEKRQKKQKNLEPSCSGFVILLGCNKKWDQLRHHNIFFSSDYKKEFKDIFESRKLPEDPTIYVTNTSLSNPDHAPAGGSNLFILINAPYVSSHQNWPHLKQFYTTFIIRQLEQKGLNGLENSIESIDIISPLDFFEKYRSNRGSIYGTSSNNKFSAFLRPRNQERSLQNLFMVGGSTHPGGGLPLVIQSAFNAIELLNRYEK